MSDRPPEGSSAPVGGRRGSGKPDGTGATAVTDAVVIAPASGDGTAGPAVEESCDDDIDEEVGTIAAVTSTGGAGCCTERRSRSSRCVVDLTTSSDVRAGTPLTGDSV